MSLKRVIFVINLIVNVQRQRRITEKNTGYEISRLIAHIKKLKYLLI